jgi:LemA protein
MKRIALIIVGIVVLLMLIGINAYNNLIMAKENVSSSWAQVENVMQRRYDLIPNLVNTVKGYAKHEKNLLVEVTRLRSQWAQAQTPQDQISASGNLESALGRLMMVVENYPDLKSNQNFLMLQNQLEGTENRIAVERMRYDNAVRNYNILTMEFPSNIFAKFLGFNHVHSYFQASMKAQHVPRVQF